MSLIVTGSIAFDTILTPGGRADDILGGSCTYFSAAARFFGPVRVVAAVGEDFPDDRLKVFQELGVCTLGLERRKGSKTFRWTGRYLDDINQRQTLDVQPNVLAEALPPVPAQYRDSRYIFLANTHPKAQMDLRKEFPKARLVVADTMDLWIRTAPDELKRLLACVDGLVLNDSEAQLLTGQADLPAAARAIAKMGPRFVVIKKGEQGCLLHHPEGGQTLGAFSASKVVDPTGAGDSFAGAMMGYLAAQDRTDLEAIRRGLAYGTVVASFTIESFGLERLRQISRADIEQRLAHYCRPGGQK